MRWGRDPKTTTKYWLNFSIPRCGRQFKHSARWNRTRVYPLRCHNWDYQKIFCLLVFEHLQQTESRFSVARLIVVVNFHPFIRFRKSLLNYHLAMSVKTARYVVRGASTSQFNARYPSTFLLLLLRDDDVLRFSPSKSGTLLIYSSTFVLYTYRTGTNSFY